VFRDAAQQLDIRDQFRGVDQGSYPTSRIITIGITTTF
jgi:hypothetical protein